MEEIKSFVEFVVTHIVDDTEKVVVTVNDGVNSGILISIETGKEDMGKLIGKQGHTVTALRDLLNVVGRKNGVFTTLIVKEPKFTPSAIDEIDLSDI